MKYSELTIVGVPKSFDLSYAVDYVQPMTEDMNLEDILYDAYPLEYDKTKNTDACVIFKYNESATGIYVSHTPHLQTLTLGLSPWAVEVDVLLCASFVNAILSKHKRARLYDKYAPLKGLTDKDVHQMIKERKRYLKHLLTMKEGFTMEGINASFSLFVADLKPAISVDMQVLELQRSFVGMQWTLE